MLNVFLRILLLINKSTIHISDNKHASMQLSAVRLTSSNMTKLEVLQLLYDSKEMLLSEYGKQGFAKMEMLANLNAYNDKLTETERQVYIDYIRDNKPCTVYNAIAVINDARQAYAKYCTDNAIAEDYRSDIDMLYVQQMLAMHSKQHMSGPLPGHNIVVNVGNMHVEDVQYICKKIDALLSKIIKDGKVIRDDHEQSDN